MPVREIEKYYDEIFRFCYHRVGSRETAEDLCQETFMSYIEGPGPRRILKNSRSYLYTIARNKCIDYYRKKKPEVLDPEAEEADSRSEEKLRSIEIRELVSCLEEELKDAIILRYFQDLKYREIAEIMGISLSKAKFLVAKALEVLQKEARE